MPRNRKGLRANAIFKDRETGATGLTYALVITSCGSWAFQNEAERKLFERLESESDRAVALIAASIIDTRLEVAIRSRLQRDAKSEESLFGVGCPLGTFAAKIDLAYLMGVFSKEARDDAHIIRGIRNRFAHDLTTLDFYDDAVKDRLNNLTLIDTHIGSYTTSDTNVHMVNVGREIPVIKILDFQSRKAEPRMRYMATCSIFDIRFCNSEIHTGVQLI